MMRTLIVLHKDDNAFNFLDSPDVRIDEFAQTCNDAKAIVVRTVPRASS